MATREVECRACGALVIAADDPALILAAQEHSMSIHSHRLPPEHVLADAVDSPDTNLGPD
ncbi:hypothetical protein ACW5CM_01840 [Microbacterium sp. A588]